MVLRVAERFGVGDPLAWWDRQTHGQRAVLLGYETIRMTEEERERGLAAGLARVR
jgi:hypothetical protein